MKFTSREIELVDGMIEVQRNHEAWDLERVALLERIKTEATDKKAIQADGKKRRRLTQSLCLGGDYGFKPQRVK